MSKSKKVTRKRNEHHEAVLCQCGCGQYFDATYTTRKPRYADKKHKAKANAPARIKKREARIKQLWAVRKKAKAMAREVINEAVKRGDPVMAGDKAFRAKMLNLLAQKFERKMMGVAK